jgi:hypothetical protein
MILNVLEIVSAAFGDEYHQTVYESPEADEVDINKVRTWLYCELMLKLHERGDGTI